MYKRLTRWLRLLGYDAKYDSTLEDEDYIPIAQNENRILVTRDELLAATAQKVGVKTILAEGVTIEERLVRLHLEAGIILSFSDEVLPRCSVCNEEIEVVDKKKIGDSVPEGSKEHYNLFWQCKNKSCEKVYWKGSHWEKMEATLKTCKEMLEKKKKQPTKKDKNKIDDNNKKEV